MGSEARRPAPSPSPRSTATPTRATPGGSSLPPLVPGGSHPAHVPEGVQTPPPPGGWQERQLAQGTRAAAGSHLTGGPGAGCGPFHRQWHAGELGPCWKGQVTATVTPGTPALHTKPACQSLGTWNSIQTGPVPFLVRVGEVSEPGQGPASLTWEATVSCSFSRLSHRRYRSTRTAFVSWGHPAMAPTQPRPKQALGKELGHWLDGH